MSASETASRTVSINRVESVPAGARVRHVDQLREEELELFYRLVRPGQAVAVDCETPRRPQMGDGEPVAGGFVDGEVIVFTDYYRVELR